MTIGDRIRRAREARELTQRDLAAACGWESESPQGRISHYETNRREPSLADLAKIAKALNVTVEHLAFGPSTQDPREAAILEAFRLTDDRGREFIQSAAQTALPDLAQRRRRRG